jgi:diketogulonate reductase-like aldo/keto reductase
MRYETLFDGTPLPVVGLGTWAIGGRMTADRSQDARSLRVLRQALELGYRHIDTAEMYGDGHTEELVGKAIQGRDRSELFITTKVAPANLGARAVTAALEASLRRLRTDYVDLYLIHWPNPAVPLRETFEALNGLRRRGLTRRLGVSNFDVPQMREAMSLSAAPLATNQVKYNLADRTPDHNGVLELCREQGLVLTAYEPLDKGRLLGESRLSRLAAEQGLPLAQAALGWLLSKPRVVTICMSENPQHLQENLEIADRSLAPELLRRLESGE